MNEAVHRHALRRKVGRATRIEVVTEGLLTRYLQRDAGLAAHHGAVDLRHSTTLLGRRSGQQRRAVPGTYTRICGCRPSATLDGAAPRGTSGRSTMVRGAQALFKTGSIWPTTRPGQRSCGSRAPSSWRSGRRRRCSRFHPGARDPPGRAWRASPAPILSAPWRSAASRTRRSGLGQTEDRYKTGDIAEMA